MLEKPLKIVLKKRVTAKPCLKLLAFSLSGDENWFQQLSLKPVKIILSTKYTCQPGKEMNDKGRQYGMSRLPQSADCGRQTG